LLHKKGITNFIEQKPSRAHCIGCAFEEVFFLLLKTKTELSINYY